MVTVNRMKSPVDKRAQISAVLVSITFSDCFPKTKKFKHYDWVVMWLRQIVASISPRGYGFNPTTVHVGFVADKVALGEACSPEYLGFSLSVSIHHCSVLSRLSPRLYNLTSW
jgi:hypothetical protein